CAVRTDQSHRGNRLEASLPEAVAGQRRRRQRRRAGELLRPATSECVHAAPEPLETPIAAAGVSRERVFDGRPAERASVQLADRRVNLARAHRPVRPLEDARHRLEHRAPLLWDWSCLKWRLSCLLEQYSAELVEWD